MLPLAVVVTLAAPRPGEAQFRRGRAAPVDGWTPISVGVRVGWDDNSRGEVLGVHGHIPVLRSGVVEIAPSADMTFLTGAKEYQYNLDVAWVLNGRQGGLFLGGGIGLRDSVGGAASLEGRRNLTTYSLFGGLRSSTSGWFQFFVDFRWIFLDDGVAGVSFNPTPFSIGVAVPLWGRAAEGS